MDLVEATVESGMCVGCGGCTLLAGGSPQSMMASRDGFLVPDTSGHAAVGIDRREFLEVCPGRRLVGPAHTRNSALWGPIRNCYAGHAADEALRYSASSGGALTAAVRYLLESGAVDCVVTMGNSAEDALRPQVTVARST